MYNPIRKIVSSKTLDELGVKKNINCFFVSKKNLNLEAVTNKEEREFIRITIIKYKEYVKSGKNCKICKENLKTHGIVCEYHFHDYCICIEDYCLDCLLLESLYASQCEMDDKK